MENKKIRNAEKTEYEGIKFDSRLELFCYLALKEAKIPFELKTQFTSVEWFIHLGKKYRPITHFPDFYMPQIYTIVDTKWYKNDVYPIKSKLLHKYFHDNNIPMVIHTPKNQKEVTALIEELKILQYFYDAGKKWWASLKK